MSDYQSRNTTSGMGTGESYNTNTGTEAVGGSLNAGTGTSGSSNADASGMMQRVTETANQAREFITDKVSGMSESMRGMGSSMGSIREMDRDDFAMMYDDMLESCRRNPGRTILIAAAAGMALGMMMRGNERRW